MSSFNFKKTLLACTASLIVAGSGSSAMAAVSIERDTYGVPKIEAETNNAMWMAFGFVQARDRIIQMDILRQTSLGELPMLSPNEILLDTAGQNAARKTRNIKVAHKYNGLKDNLQSQLQNSPDKSGTEALACFAAGVSAFRHLVVGKPDNEARCDTSAAEIYKAEPDKLTKKEFAKLQEFNAALKLGFEKTDWTAVDVAALFHLQVMDEFSNRNTEMNNLQNLIDLTRVHGDDKKAARVFNSIKWAQDPTAATTIPAKADLITKSAIKTTEYHKKLTANIDSKAGNFNGCKVYSSEAFRSKIKDQLKYAMHKKSDRFPYQASNWWAVSQATKAKANPDVTAGILFNGPQIAALNPTKTYQVSLKSDEGFQVAGNSYPGTINFWQGYNGDLAFGLTAGNIDVSDIFCVDTYQDKDGYYYVTKSKEKRYFENTDRSGGQLHTVGTSWPMVAFDENPNKREKVRGTAYIQRYNWQGKTISSLLSWIKAVNAPTLQEWHSHLDNIGGNFNLVGLDAEGVISYRLTGSLPIKAGMKTPVSNDAENWDYYPDYDPRLPSAMAPDDGWDKKADFYHKLSYTMSDGNLANWNQKPFINMPDGDLDYDSYFRFDRVHLIQNELLQNRKDAGGAPWTLEEMFEFNGRLQRLDVNYFAYRPFLQRLKNEILSQTELKTEEKNKLLRAVDLMLSWNGMRGDNTNAERDKMGAHYGHIIFYNWIDELTLNYAKIIAAKDKDFTDHLMGTLLKTKQPYFPNKTNDQGRAKPRPTFLTSHGIHINSRIILNDLHSVFNIPESETVFGGTETKGYQHKYGDYQEHIGSDQPIPLMISALKSAVWDTERYIGFDARQFLEDNPHFPPEIATYSGVSTTIGPNDVQIGFMPKTPTVRHFRNRGALNIGVGFKDGQGQGGNVTYPGIREYRGFVDEKDLYEDQIKLFHDNEYRKMTPLPSRAAMLKKKLKSKL